MLDHIIFSVNDIDRSIAFCTTALAPLGVTNRLDYDGKDGPPGHPDLKGFGANGRLFLWLKEGSVEDGAAHIVSLRVPSYAAHLPSRRKRP